MSSSIVLLRIVLDETAADAVADGHYRNDRKDRMFERRERDKSKSDGDDALEE